MPHNLRTRINKLAKWQIDTSSIEFPQDTCEFHGGHATVSRALAVSTSNDENSAGGSEDAKDGKGSYGDNALKKAIAVKKLKIDNESDRERVLGGSGIAGGTVSQNCHQAPGPR